MNLQKMMKQAQEMQQKLATAQAKLEEEESEGSSGGGMVVVKLNGKGVMKKKGKNIPFLKEPSHLSV